MKLRPEIAKRLIVEITVVERPYIYHLVKGANIVKRLHIDDSKDGKSTNEPEQQKHRKNDWVPKGQKRLLKFAQH